MSDTELDWGRRFCDVVMKGGITSGVVYPSAIAELAAKYELRNIGGASAGAIASAGAAAAEYRRQTETDPAQKFAGFDRLRGLADELGQRDGAHSRLFHLFLPSRQAQPMFSILTRVLNLKSVVSRLIWGIAGLFMAFPLPALVGLVIGALTLSVVWHGGTTIALPLVLPSALSAWQAAFNGFAFLLAVSFTVAFTLALAIALCVWRALRRFAKVMAAQDFGLCTGMRAADQSAEPPALTEWLYALFQDIAGKPHGAPLTFGDLRAVDFAGVEDQDGIVLRVMTTCLTGGRPYTLPFEPNTHFFFDADELGRYFPKEVIEWMKAASLKASDHAAAALGVDEETETVKTLAANELHGKLIELPPADDLPVILAVRLSLSFPILLSALPLYRESLRKLPGSPLSSGLPESPAPKWEKYMERVLFTDGGVCSNLPVHMFDAPLPAWPTFAINLRSDFQAEDPNEPPSARAVRPKRGQGFRGDRYPIGREANLASVASFLTAIISTMQNWRDVLQRSAPGSRDRVVTVRHTEEEGGLNLDMPEEAIKLMAASGTLAAQKLIDDFHAEPGPADLSDDWTYHRWVRLRNLLRVLPEYLHRVSSAYTSLHNHPVITELLDRSQHYVAHSYRMDKENAEAANVLLDKLSHLIDEVEALRPDFEKFSPSPKGELRITPRF